MTVGDIDPSTGLTIRAECVSNSHNYQPRHYEVIPKAILELREQIVNLNWVTCPRCGYRWQYRGLGKKMKCSRCYWNEADKEAKKVYNRTFRTKRKLYLL
jgi:hypothetical protein